MADSESIFETGRLGPLEEFIGCIIQNMPDRSKKIIQPDMIKKREKNFGDKVINHRCAATQMGTGITVERPEEKEQQRYYRKGYWDALISCETLKAEPKQCSPRIVQGDGWSNGGTSTPYVQSAQVCIRYKRERNHG
jgi:hypothetical protein